ncbi:hypothetical protein HAX54_040086 [Datura stramonium]|uniref:Uncharacterized protein n=1 Tax=Datura stramonium TaxID=4076 RepID=A0ABS8VQX3_DATST|nr:hypothetical protein [Datura stramonium]
MKFLMVLRLLTLGRGEGLISVYSAFLGMESWPQSPVGLRITVNMGRGRNSRLPCPCKLPSFYSSPELELSQISLQVDKSKRRKAVTPGLHSTKEKSKMATAFGLGKEKRMEELADEARD